MLGLFYLNTRSLLLEYEVSFTLPAGALLLNTRSLVLEYEVSFT
jgi:hypothetical protein